MGNGQEMTCSPIRSSLFFRLFPDAVVVVDVDDDNDGGNGDLEKDGSGPC